MLPPFIIEQIRQREELERIKHYEQVLELPLPEPLSPQTVEDDQDRGVIIIDLGV
ncbi:MAG: hypothetical protein H6715_02400 [Myxococcales bacterium]|nr:hypothetical protein [Myxococcales bacterium]MCB9708745.1 hypothetical protein [Myxococcales bacterium]